MKQDIWWLRAATLDEPLEAVATVLDREERDGRRSVLIETVVSQGDVRVMSIQAKLGWPT